jgi:retron-type reverse transcriptase
MYYSVSKRPRSRRRIPVAAHEGSAADFLRRHQAEAAEAARAGGSARDEFLHRLLDRIADTRNILLAVERVIAADTAAGADGLRPGDLDRRAQLELARLLSRVLKDRTYRPGAIKKVDIPKPSGGYRTLSIPTVIDRIVQVAILQIIQPFVDPQFLPTTLGGRPGMSTAHALVVAGHLAAVGNRWVLVAADVRKAFDVVPQDRLIDVVHEKFGDTVVTELITTVVHAGGTNGVGIGQGSPMSPLLLNLYLDAVLDRPWREAFPDVHLLRWVDDVLLLCETRHEAESSLRVPTRMLEEERMPIKLEPPPTINDLGRGKTVVWLGFELHLKEGRLEASVSSRAWEGLRQGLRNAHGADLPTVRAREVILGWIGYLGPCFKANEVDTTYGRITEIATEEGFEEIPTTEEVRERWAGAFDRYREGRQRFDREVHAHRDDEDDQRSTAPDAAPPVHKFAILVPTEGEVVFLPSSHRDNPTAGEPISTDPPSYPDHTARRPVAVTLDSTHPPRLPPRRQHDEGRHPRRQSDSKCAPRHRRQGATRPGLDPRSEFASGPGPARPPPAGGPGSRTELQPG